MLLQTSQLFYQLSRDPSYGWDSMGTLYLTNLRTLETANIGVEIGVELRVVGRVPKGLRQWQGRSSYPVIKRTLSLFFKIIQHIKIQ